MLINGNNAAEDIENIQVDSSIFSKNIKYASSGPLDLNEDILFTESKLNQRVLKIN
jgi:hypothetical protein